MPRVHQRLQASPHHHFHGDIKKIFVRARIVWSTQQRPVVPVIAVSRIGGLYFAFVAESDSKGGYVVHQKPLQVGPIVGNDYVVLEGIKPGDKVVVTGTQFLVDGIPVIPQESST